MPNAPLAGISIPVKDQSPTGNQGKASTDDLWETIKSLRADLQTVVFWVQKHSAQIPLTGGFRVVCPVAGVIRVYATSDTATAGSTGAAYHIVTATRQGQASAPQAIDTRQGELAAYSEQYLGEFSVGQGDVLSVAVAVTGAPVPSLSTSNFVIRCSLKERS